MCKQFSVPVSRVSGVQSVTRCPERTPSAIRTFRVLWLVAFAVVWTMAGHSGIAIGQVAGVDDPSDMADSSGDIKRIEAWVDDGNLHLTMTVYGVFAPAVSETQAGMTNRYYYHWIFDTDNNPATGYNNSEYEGSATNLKSPIGADLVVQFGWRDGNTNGVYAYDPLTEASLFEDYAYTIDGDTIHAVIPLADLGLTPDDTIALSAFQEGASNGWQVDWIESVVLALTVVKASNPIPAADSNDIARDVILTWDSGELAVQHNVYFGTHWNDVNDASAGNPLGVLLGQGLADSSMDAGRLDFGQTYFWRVDEVNGAPDFTIFKGDVWSFMTEPYSIRVPIEFDKATASSSITVNTPDMTINGSGLEGHTHSANGEDMWLSSPSDPSPWLMYEFSQPQKLDQMLIWNSNSSSEGFVGWGIKDVNIEYSIDGTQWTGLSEPNQIARAPGLPTYSEPQVVDFGLALARYVRINILSNWGGILKQYGVSEVQFLGVPVYARTPDPASGSVAVPPNSVVSWRAGREAGQHTIYVSADPNEVAEDLAPSVTSNTNSLDLISLDLQLDETYYWRVDEVNDAEIPSVWAGPVWHLSTSAGLIVDDFESYGNFSPNRPFQTWLDGAGYSADEYFPVAYGGNGTGAGVGHDIWSPGSPYFNGQITEKTITMTGSSQSMPFYYNNSGGVPSQIDRKWSTPQDWNAHGIQMLVLYFYGAEGNTGQLYVTINDTRVLYEGDASNLSELTWTPWIIDLGSLAVSSVNTLSIGVEGAGAKGLLLIDEIGLYKSAPVTP
ncbi:MAG: discoidin domain-containing protein [Phycisphaerae bacterium]|nr:discoidin domain-containing protein [Phycisphaerae bacterium]